MKSRQNLYITTLFCIVLSSDFIFHYYQTFQNVKCLEVYDADTIIVEFLKGENAGERARIRFAYIDALELKQNSLLGTPYGKIARDRLANLIKGKKIELKIISKDMYGRYVGEIYYKEKMMNLLLIEEGLALPFFIFVKDQIPLKRKFYYAYQNAKIKKLGIFNSKGFFKPSAYRKLLKNHTRVEH